MRPVRIRLEGFSVYRNPTEVDLEGVDFFSLSGPTGSGKSSLIDAMIFALYGRVPRLGGNAVAPVVSAGADRARVAFDFEVGSDTYTAARLVQRTARGGASVSEARLEKGDEVLADGADDLTEAVEELLHLKFDDFVRTVVLPQGQFARFLNSTKAERQALLRNLLGLDVYAAVRGKAKEREAAANARAAMADAQVKSVRLPAEAEIAAVNDRLEALERLAESVGAWEAELGEMEASLADVRSIKAARDSGLEALRVLEPPDRMGELEGLAAGARDRLEAVNTDLESATKERSLLESRLGALLSEQTIRGHLDLWAKRESLKERLLGLRSEGAVAAVAKAEAAVAEGRETLERVESDLELLRISHAAHQLAGGLTTGDPCPVCERPLDETPDKEPPPGMASYEEAQRRAYNDLQSRVDAMQTAQNERAAVDASVSEVRSQRDDVEASLDGVPTTAELEELLEQRSKASADLETAAKLEKELSEKKRDAQTELEQLSESIRTIQRDLFEARERVVALEPPLPESEDPIVQWKELLAWRDTKRDEVARLVEETAAEVAAAEEAFASRQSSVRRELAKAGIDADSAYAVEITRHLSKAQALAESHERAAAEAAKLEEVIKAAESEAAIANSLAGHLTAAGFERWLMAGAIADLVGGANDLLKQLSDDGYSLSSDTQGAFSIVDHRNANEVRTVTTLSGGETFLVSLALALSLAETLASAGGADLDAIILDEGFGTLDDESLEIVASVLEELSGKGPMVGVITHVKELAARAPVRFEVSKTTAGASVRVAS